MAFEPKKPSTIKPDSMSADDWRAWSKLMKTRRISQAEIAKRFGISPITLTRWKKTGAPGWAAYAAAAVIYGLPPWKAPKP